MTTPAGAISLQDIITECGGSNPIAFDAWYVQHVAKRWDGPISMSAMRGKTCFPGNSPLFGINYVASANYSITSVYWAHDTSNNQVTICENATVRYVGLSSTASRGYINVGNIRFYRANEMSRSATVIYYAMRWVEG
jgi:hypothetical protein